MSRFLPIFATFAAAAISVLPASADDSWADDMISAQAAAERPAARTSVRVASLGNADVDTDSRPLRAKRAKTINAEDRPQTRRTRVASLGTPDVDTESRPLRAKTAKSKATEDRPQARRTRVASLGNVRPAEVEGPRRSLSGGSVNWTADSGCLDGTLRGIIRSLAASFGPVTVNSTCRSRSHNASVGGAPRSMHLTGQAVDFRVHSNVSAIYASLRSNGSVGGLKHYGGGLFHIDTGPRRSW